MTRLFKRIQHLIALKIMNIKTIKMKKTIFTLAVTMVIAGAMITGCQSSAEKVESAQDKVKTAEDNVTVANQELNQAIKDSIRQFKKESEEQITAYDKSIAEFKVKIKTENKENRARYEKRLAEMEQQNREMKRRLEDFNDDRMGEWDTFRARFKHDMEAQGKAFHDFWSGR